MKGGGDTWHFVTFCDMCRQLFVHVICHKISQNVTKCHLMSCGTASQKIRARNLDCEISIMSRSTYCMPRRGSQWRSRWWLPLQTVSGTGGRVVEDPWDNCQPHSAGRGEEKPDQVQTHSSTDSAWVMRLEQSALSRGYALYYLVGREAGYTKILSACDEFKMMG